MFPWAFLKRTFPLRCGQRKHLCLAQTPKKFFPKYPVKQQCNITSKTNFCKNINSFACSQVKINEYNSEERKSKTSSEISEVLDNINLDIKNHNRVKYEDAKKLLSFMREGLIAENEKYALLLLEWCCNFMPDVDSVSRISLALSVWKFLTSVGIEIKAKHYNVLLKCYAANSYKIPVMKFLSEMKEVVPESTTYELLLDCACVVGDLEEAMLVIKLMKDKNMPISEATFNSLILGYARAGDIKNSLSTLDAMYAANIFPSAKTYTVVLQSYAHFGNIKEMKRVYEEAASKNINLNIHLVMNICRTLAVNQHDKLILEFLDWLPNDLKRFTLAVENTILELIHLNCEKAALSIMMSVLPEGVHTAEQSCAFFVYEICRANIDPGNIINICNYLEKNEMYPRALYKAAEVSLHLGKPDLTLPIFQTLAKNGETLRPHYFWPLFKQSAKVDGEAGVLKTLKEMQAFKVIPDFHTLVDYILPVISTNNPETTVQKLQDCGVAAHHSLTSVAATLLLTGKSYVTKMDYDKLMQPLVETFIVNKKIQPVSAFLKVASKHVTNDLAGHFVLELLAIKRTRLRKDDVINLLQSFKSVGLSISPFASEIIARYFKNGGADSNLYNQISLLLTSITQSDLQLSPSETIDASIPHPRDMNLEELENHLVELKSKLMNTRGVLRRLLQLHMREGNIKRVLEVKKELENSGFKFSPGMLASLFDMYIKFEDESSAEKILNEIMNDAPNFIIDEHKIIDYASLLVTKNQYKAAISVLERRAASGNIYGGEGISRNCWHLLNTLALQGEAEKVKHMFHLLRTLGFCSVTNTLLGPLVRAHLVRGETESAVREYQHCATNFKTTPLQLELMSYLVRQTDSPNNQKLLEDTLVASSLVHGEASTYATYIVALAEAGKKREIQNFIAKNGSNVHSASLLSKIKLLVKENKLGPLLILAEECDRLPKFNSSLLYTSVLKVLDKQGDCDGALKLWTLMQEKNVQPSNEFYKHLASILKSHKRQIPFVVTESEQ
ncbi:Leucine-rich PPR motif-containing protein, mitochondrial [Gryllus bimaculatus]|nr:Leucine-rich PPR motif-containing protein, mitochondrial [Gryllus bimaculatus]